MLVNYLGHAGFLVETEDSIVIMDPWLSEDGAFDGGWFQFPRNHHMADFVIKKLSETTKKIFVYISHEHKDHFDPYFLKKLEIFDFEYVIPVFRRKALLNEIKTFTKNKITYCHNEMVVNLSDNDSIIVYVEDGELERDSAIILKSGNKTFLNLNDCRIQDRLSQILKENNKIDIYTAQFSGATWHPTCYDYTEDEYRKISKLKKISKFESLVKTIEVLNPGIYFPSAGPACFLDPDTIHINFQKDNIFPRNYEVLNYLKKRLKNSLTKFEDVLPGDIIKHEDGEFIIEKQSTVNFTEESFVSYINNYASDYNDFFKKLKKPLETEDFIKVRHYLIGELQNKLDNFKSYDKINRPLYIYFSDKEESSYIKIDFISKKICEVYEIIEDNFYKVGLKSYDIKRIMEKFLTWEDYSLTFRMQIKRIPDIYQVLLQGFLILEKEDLNFFCDKILEIEQRTERIVVDIDGTKYKIDRYCPHQGADLIDAPIKNGKVICPRHRWEFDVKNNGNCLENCASINAISLEEIVDPPS